MKRQSRGFTLIELLVVIAIIAILAAILLPVYNRAKEGGYQAHCAATLSQIGTAVRLYYQDEKRYPPSLASLMPPTSEIHNYATNADVTNTGGGDYLKTAEKYILCQDDDTPQEFARASYGDLSTDITQAGTPAPTTPDWGRYVWNFWGYQDTGFVHKTMADASAVANQPYFVDPSAGYNQKTNPIRYSLSNRFAPTSTIITHCIYHRVPTAANLSKPDELYTTATDDAGAQDIILRLDGSARKLDVSTFKSKDSWRKQSF